MGVAINDLKNILDIVDKKDYDLLYSLLQKFIPYSEALSDEKIAIAQAENEIQHCEIFDMSSINWG